ncbi:MAG: homoserine dehydrogenase [Methanocalculus sp. MSAO_Arc1]|uniref:homoserine dehydrogenase n=1 Tax=Methanocalculus TaxID=71151 RepID=UPI000FF2F50B|nr:MULTISPECIES: homoserine dehydrogenase [unclassified Methanocalculus]MCP1662483.1 homoserine dehydrogenase [Methanocalculus sp. AMF5]RQD80826.1 MAG: homoserine dehydrogenase [Methanocalculus sp. MSAO_Arc1]
MRIAIIGFGAVGQGLARVLAADDHGFSVTAIADSKSAVIAPEGLDPDTVLAFKRETGLCGTAGLAASDILASGAFDILVETSPTNANGGEPATSIIRSALSAGKHVVTSNKGPIACAFQALQETADQSGAHLMYEATVAGAVPIVNALRSGLAGNSVRSLHGILNGTCNYILTRMRDEGLTYSQALQEARDLGYAEADPTYDVQGIDTAIKLVILANTILGMNVDLADVEINGIDLITAESLTLAEDQGATIRLIGEILPEKNQVRVSPRLIPLDHPLVVDGTLNAISVCCDLAGPVTFIGKGAGPIPTASAILADLILIRNCHGRGA